MTHATNLEMFRTDFLKSAQQQIKNCQLCPLCKYKSKLLTGNGNENASIMFVSDAVGDIECETGIPFSGASKPIFEKALEANNIKRKDIYTTSCLRCSIRGVTDINLQWFSTCSKHLFYQLELIKPKVVCTMGKQSTKVVLAKYNLEEQHDMLAKLHGNPILVRPITKVINRKKVQVPSSKFYLVPTFNPAGIDNIAIEQAIISDVSVAKYIDNLKTFLF